MTSYLSGQTSSWTIRQPSASAGFIQVQFSFFDITNTSSIKDWLEICDGSGRNCTQYSNRSSTSAITPGTTAGQWSVPVPGDTLKLTFRSASTAGVRGKGFTIKTMRYTTSPTEAVMKTRMQVAQEALNEVLLANYDTMTWGFATFNGASSDGAYIPQNTKLNNNNPASLASLQAAIDSAVSDGGTPLGGALQDIFVQGFQKQKHNILNTSCNKNFIFVLTDGFPSNDFIWNKIPGVNFALTNDGHGWTQDPFQYADPAPDYYNDVAKYLYTHSFYDQSLIPEASRATSSENIRTYQLSFYTVHPLLQDAAIAGGGIEQYFTVFNAAQLAKALEQIVSTMANTVSYSSPAASVDAGNKMQNGKDMYFGFFLPSQIDSWHGNLKKFTLGDSSRGQNPMLLYDGAGQPAVDGYGNFQDTVTDHWTKTAGSSGATDNGAGQLLLNMVKTNFASGGESNRTLYWSRKIYSLNNSAGRYSITRFDQAVAPAALGLTATDILTRNKIVNYVHGYTYDISTADSSRPVAVRPWILGSIIHSKPVVIDYYSNDLKTVVKRYVAVGANDGMLHIFDDTPGGTKNGQEVAAFIPGDLLPNLRWLPQKGLVDMVDGPITLYSNNQQPKYLLFGERRGGDMTPLHQGSYWCLDISSGPDPAGWSIKWQYTNPIISQTWSDVRIASIPVDVDSSGKHRFQDVAIFTGGYDPMEDNFPEPFTDKYLTGNPYSTSANSSPVLGELALVAGGYPPPAADIWTPGSQNDVNRNNRYDPFNPGSDRFGQGIFVVDIDDPSRVHVAGGKQILPFQVVYSASGSSANATTGASQKRADMKYCFPASPAVVVGTYSYTYRNNPEELLSGVRNNVLRSIYGIDIYANIFKVVFDWNLRVSKDAVDPDNVSRWTWSAGGSDWLTTKIFSANPGSTSPIDNVVKGADNPADLGRKAFSPPTVSWGGSGVYFDKGNYLHPFTTFAGISDIATLFFGTGDREHPLYTLISNRMYAVYDDSSVTATQYNSNGNGEVIGNPVVSTVGYGGRNGYNERDLLNVTCGINGPYTINHAAIHPPVTREQLLAFLTDDATYTPNPNAHSILALENGANENDAKGWYIALDKQGACDTKSGKVDDIAGNLNSRDNHYGEAVNSQAILYGGIVYFTTYQPTSGLATCNPTGNGFAYALDYTTSDAALKLNLLNGEDIEVTDRYMKYTDIHGIPTGFSIFTNGRETGAMAMMGGSLIGPKGPGIFPIPSSGLGLELYYWREGNSRKK
jgi:type IV pilus assembly protein PilY1